MLSLSLNTWANILFPSVLWRKSRDYHISRYFISCYQNTILFRYISFYIQTIFYDCIITLINTPSLLNTYYNFNLEHGILAWYGIIYSYRESWVNRSRWWKTNESNAVYFCLVSQVPFIIYSVQSLICRVSDMPIKHPASTLIQQSFTVIPFVLYAIAIKTPCILVASVTIWLSWL